MDASCNILGNFDIFDERWRRYQRGILFPTSHGDYLDRAVKSLAKELDVPVNVELLNAQAVKVDLDFLDQL